MEDCLQDQSTWWLVSQPYCRHKKCHSHEGFVRNSPLWTFFFRNDLTLALVAQRTHLYFRMYFGGYFKENHSVLRLTPIFSINNWCIAIRDVLWTLGVEIVPKIMQPLGPKYTSPYPLLDVTWNDRKGSDKRKTAGVFESSRAESSSTKNVVASNVTTLNLERRSCC